MERACDGLDVTVEQHDRDPVRPTTSSASSPAPTSRVGSPTRSPRLPALRVVATPSTGFDHLDLGALAAAGVWATNVSGYCDDEVADHAIAMAIDLLRGVTLLDRSVRSGEWDYAVAFPRRIARATLGVVGFGRIGRVAAEPRPALGMRVWRTTRSCRPRPSARPAWCRAPRCTS